MSSTYVVTEMAAGDEEKSFPFLYGAAPSATLQNWRRFCGQRADQKLITARTAAGYIKGLCAYFETEHLSRGRLIEVPLFLVASAADPQGVAEELLWNLRKICGEHGCSAVRVAAPPQGWIDASLLADGQSGDDDAVYFAPLAS